MTSALDLDRVQSLLRTEFTGRRVFYEQSVPTTMDLARRAAEAHAPEGTVAIAEEQTAGRGRLGRTWVSPPGENLYFTIIVRPAFHELRYLSVIAPLAICQAIEETTNLLPRIKWPNDVVINDKKVGGVLIESELSDNRVLFALIGPGINVNMDAAAHEEIRDIATSLRAELDRELAREDLLAAILNHFEALYQSLRRGEVVSVAWKHRLDTLGKHVRVLSLRGPLDEGVAVDADSDGSLILRRDDGAHVRIEAGEVTLRES